MALFPSGFSGGLFGGSLGRDPGGLLSPFFNNQNAMLGYLSGALQGGGLGESIGRGLQGWMAGSQADATQRGQRAALQYIAADPNIPDDLKRYAISDPSIASEYMKNFFKPGEVMNVDGTFVRKNNWGVPQVLGGIPTRRTTEPGQDVSYETPPGVPAIGARPMAPVAGVPGQSGPQPGFKSVTQVGGPKLSDIAAFRDDATKDKRIELYQATAPIYNSLLRSYASNDPGTDINFIYGILKIVDPGSAVLTGEQRTVQNSQSIPDAFVGQINKALTGQGTLQPDIKHALLRLAENRMLEYEGPARAAYGQYMKAAKDLRIPEHALPVLTSMGPMPYPPNASATQQPASPRYPQAGPLDDPTKFNALDALVRAPTAEPSTAPGTYRDIRPSAAQTAPVRPYSPGASLPPPDVRVGPRPPVKDQTRPTMPMPQIGEVRAGYRFIGGDPNNWQSWQRVQ